MPVNPGGFSSPEKPKQKAAAPKKEPEKKAGTVALILSILIALAVVAGAYIWGYFLNIELQERQSTLSDRELQLKKIQQQVKREGTKKEAELSTLSQNISNIEVKSYKWSKFIKELDEILPRSVIISSYTGQYIHREEGDNKPNIVTIKGVANSYSAIADTIDIIEDSKLFKNVEFSGSSKKYSTGIKPTEAQLSLAFELEELEKDKEMEDRKIPQVLSYSTGDSDNVSVEQIEIEEILAPTDFELEGTAINPSKGEIELRWEAPDEGDIVEYQISVADKSGQTLTPNSEMITVPVVSRAFTNTYLYETEYPTREYFFRIIAVDRSGKKSQPTTELSAIAGDREAPEAPYIDIDSIERGLAARENYMERIELNWEESDSDDVYRYHIYEGTDPDDLRLIHSTKGENETSFEYTREVVFGELYYKVVAEDKSGNLSNSQAEVIR